MIYKVLKILVKLTLFFFFRKRIVQGSENIPQKGPTILVANHPVTFLDPLLIAVATKRPVHFLAKGAMFKNGLIRAIFKAFNMIPIYRAQDNPDDMSKNQDTFKYCYEHLEKGGLILIFPEGISVTDRTLKPLKTGAARIALGAEERNDFKLGVQIVPIGLTYEKPHQFRKDVLVNIGQGIMMSDFQKEYKVDARICVQHVVEMIKNHLIQLTLNVSKPSFLPVANYLLEQHAKSELPFNKNVELVRETLAKLYKHPERNGIQMQLKRIAQREKQIGLESLSIEEGSSNILISSVLSLATFLVAIPMLLFGFLQNAVPYFLSPLIARLISKEYEYQGPISMTAGMVICLLIYPIFFFVMLTYSESLILSTIYLISLPISGIVTYGFFQQLNYLKIRWRLLFLFNKKSDQVSALVLEKKALIKGLVRISPSLQIRN